MFRARGRATGILLCRCGSGRYHWKSDALDIIPGIAAGSSRVCFKSATMPIQISCPGCKASYAVDDELGGKKIRCRKCEAPVAVPAAEPADLSRWYYVKNKAKHGPVLFAEIVRLVEAGELRPTDLVWQEGTAKWVPAASVRE